MSEITRENPIAGVYDNTNPGVKWEFDEKVTEAFPSMLERSIPSYNVMRSLCFDLACEYVRPGADVLDLGCSRGDAIMPLVEKYAVQNRFFGVEVSPPMLEICRSRFERWINLDVVKILDTDLRTAYPPVHACVTMAILTIQFVPIEHRLKILRNIYKHTNVNGALIMVEKVIGSSAEMDGLLVKHYYKMKAENGYTQEQIDRKRMALEGVLVPVGAAYNEDLLRSAGFSHVERFWQHLNFAGWIAVKDRAD